MVPSQAEFIDWMEFIYEIDITADKIHVMWYDDDGWSEESLEAAEKFDITFDLEFN
jgi:hypothetical protein